jgi:uncharacterized protein
MTSTGAPATPADPVMAMLLRLVDELHACGVASSLGEAIDAARALQVIDIGDRPVLRSALRATLVKRPEDVRSFEQLFDQCFPMTTEAATGSGRAARSDAATATATGTPVDNAAVRPRTEDDNAGGRGSIDVDEIMETIARDEQDELRELAKRLVRDHAGLGEGRASERYLLKRLLTALDLARVLREAMRTSVTQDPDELRRLLERLNERLDRFKRMLGEEVRVALFAEVTRTGVGLVAPRRIEDSPVLDASVRELAEMRRAVRPLAQKLARRLAQRRRNDHRGRLDMRRTLRQSLQSGGVPLDLRFRRRRPSKPDVVVLCDISGSVAEFAHFTLMFLQSLQGELRGLRSFVFVDGVAEITSIVEEARADLDPRLLVTLAGVIVDDGHSNYEAAFRRFLGKYADAVKPSTTVIITGDARTNYRTPGIAALEEIGRHARSVYWFNPEPAGNWGSHDSSIRLFAPACSGVHEVRTLAQLSSAIAAIL